MESLKVIKVLQHCVNQIYLLSSKDESKKPKSDFNGGER